jgi:membrane protein implicated in regulation of membrane protease activity
MLSLRHARGASKAPTFSAARSWAIALVLLLPFGPWPEDKGTALAVALLVAMVVSERTRERRQTRGQTNRSVCQVPSSASDRLG